MYVTGEEHDVRAHTGFHKDYTCGIQFKGWRNERVAHVPKLGGGRILLVMDCDPPAHRNKVMEVVKMMEIELGSEWIFLKLFQVYLYVLSQRVVGFLVAEPINEAHKILSCKEYGSSDVKTTNKKKASTLKFGDIKFHREVISKPIYVPEASNEHLHGATVCKKEAVRAV